MRLLAIHYRKDNEVKQIVGIVIVEHDDRYSCLRSDKLSNSDISMIQEFSKMIDTMNIEGKVAWLKKNVQSYNSAYRELKKEHATVVDSFEI